MSTACDPSGGLGQAPAAAPVTTSTPPRPWTQPVVPFSKLPLLTKLPCPNADDPNTSVRARIQINVDHCRPRTHPLFLPQSNWLTADMSDMFFLPLIGNRSFLLPTSMLQVGRRTQSKRCNIEKVLSCSHLCFLRVEVTVSYGQEDQVAHGVYDRRW